MVKFSIFLVWKTQDSVMMSILTKLTYVQCNSIEIHRSYFCWVEIDYLAGYGGSHMWSQHFGRLRWVDHLRSGVRDQPDQHGKTPISTKNTKIIQEWWQVPVIPDTKESEAGESFETGRQRLQWAEIMPMHFNLGNNSETPLQK